MKEIFRKVSYYFSYRNRKRMSYNKSSKKLLNQFNIGAKILDARTLGVHELRDYKEHDMIVLMCNGCDFYIKLDRSSFFKQIEVITKNIKDKK